jgi:hypothetical protein
MPPSSGWSEDPEDGGIMDLWNVGVFPQHYMALQPKRRGRGREENVGRNYSKVE